MTAPQFSRIHIVSVVVAIALVAIPLSLAEDKPGSVKHDHPTSQDVRTDARRDSVQADAQAKGETSDTAMTRQIQKHIKADKGVSSDGKNVKVVSNRGSVILSGTVGSEAEKIKIEGIAKKHAKTTLVENDIEVKAQ